MASYKRELSSLLFLVLILATMFPSNVMAQSQDQRTAAGITFSLTVGPSAVHAETESDVSLEEILMQGVITNLATSATIGVDEYAQNTMSRVTSCLGCFPGAAKEAEVVFHVSSNDSDLNDDLSVECDNYSSSGTVYDGGSCKTLTVTYGFPLALTTARAATSSLSRQLIIGALDDALSLPSSYASAIGVSSRIPEIRGCSVIDKSPMGLEVSPGVFNGVNVLYSCQGSTSILLSRMDNALVGARQSIPSHRLNHLIGGNPASVSLRSKSRRTVAHASWSGAFDYSAVVQSDRALGVKEVLRMLGEIK